MVNLGPGFGEGFTSGMNAASQRREAQAKMEAVQQAKMDSMIEAISAGALTQIKNIQDHIAAAPQRDGNLDTLVTNQSAPVEELIKGLQQLPSDKAKLVAHSLSAQLAQVKSTQTQSEANTAKYEAEVSSGKQLAGIKDQPATPPAPQAAGTQPQPTPPPSVPTAGVGQPQVAQGSQAPMPVPTQPASPMTDQAEAAPSAPIVGAPPAGGISTAPAAPAAPAPAAPGEEPMMTEAELRQSILKKIYPTPKDAYNDKLDNALATQQIKEYGTNNENALSIKNNDTALDLLNSEDGIYYGTGAEARYELAKAGQTAGVTSSDKKIANTENFKAITLQAATFILHKFGSGTGISDYDFKNAQKIVGGDINLSKEGLESILQTANRLRSEEIQQFNKKAPGKLQIEVPTSRYAPPASAGGNAGAPDKDGWVTVSPGVRIRQRPQ